MKKLLKKLDRRFQLSRPGSVLILVVALLVLMALIGTAFLSSTRIGRYETVQTTNNTEMDLLLEGVKNMAKATIVGSLNDPSLPFPYRPAFKYINSYTNSSGTLVNIPALTKNWDIPDFFHQYTNDPLIGTTANDAWLSPRCPTDFQDPTNVNPPTVAWPCLGEPFSGTTFESPIVLSSSAVGNASLAGIPLTYSDRITRDYVPPFPTQLAYIQANTNYVVAGNRLTPTFATISYPDGTSVSYPAFTIAQINNTVTNQTVQTSLTPYSYGTLTLSGGAVSLNPMATPTSYTYLAGDADGDGIADCGLVKLPVGPIDGITYYAGMRIVDNSSAVNVNTATSRRYDFSGGFSLAGAPTPIPTRWFGATPGSPPTSIYPPNFQGTYNLGCFESNVGLAELLQTYDGYSQDNGSGTLGLSTNGQSSEIANLIQYRLNNQLPAAGVTGVNVTAGITPSSYPVADTNVSRSDFEFSTLGDLFDSQIARRPTNPGYSAVGYPCQAFTDTDASALAYHFVFNNPNTSPTPVELVLHNSVYDTAPNGLTAPPTRAVTNGYGLLPGVGSTSYVGTASTSATIVSGWYSDNFDWAGDFVPNSAEGGMALIGAQAQNCGIRNRPRRSILTVDSGVSNLVPQPTLPTITSASASAGPATVTYSTQPTGTRPYTVWSGVAPNMYPTGMSTITSTLCKTSINTAIFPDLWRAFWLAMSSDEGLSPLGTNTDSTTKYPLGTDGTTYLYDHDLVSGQSIYTGMQFSNPGTATGADQTSYKTQDYNQGAFWTPSTDPQHPQAMFRSTLRDPKNVYYQYPAPATRTDSYIEADQMVLLRSAIAAANVTAMRYPAKGCNSANVSNNGNAPIFAYDVPLKATVTGTAQTVYARVFGVTRQPYITEVYVSTDTTTTNTKPYLAVELFNPYNQDIDLTNWQLISVDRDPTAVGSQRSPTVIYKFAGSVVPADGYALLEDYPASGVTARPPSSGLSATGTISTNGSGATITDIPISNLQNLIPTSGYANQELMLMRPLAYAGTDGNTMNQVPVDSYDFTGLVYGRTDPKTSQPIADVWHYVRGNATNSSNNTLWDFIYPGRYDASDPMPYNTTGVASSPEPPTLPANAGTEPRNAVQIPAFSTLNGTGTIGFSRRQQGTEAGYFYPGSQQDPFSNSSIPPITLGDRNYTSSYPINFPFQYLNGDQPGPTTMPAGSVPNMYPFGQFARNSDMLQVPFVGSYIIFKAQPSGFPATGVGTALSPTDVSNIIEINPLPMDCSFAEDTDVSDDPPSTESNGSGGSTAPNYVWNESVGHFAPVNTSLVDNNIRKANPGSGANLPNPQQTIADADPSLSYSSSMDPYTAYKVQYSTDPTAYNGASTPVTTPEKYWRYHWASRIFDYLTVQNPNDDYSPNVQQNIYTTFNSTAPLPVQNTASILPAASATPNNPYVEDTVPVYGLINLNTAPWRVLTALRICPYDDAEVDASGNPLSAQFIINAATGTVALSTVLPASQRVPDNVQLAQAIAYWRDQGPNVTSAQALNASTSQLNTTAYPYGVFKGPFNSVADILNVPAVHNYLQAIDFIKSQTITGPPPVTVTASPEPDAVQGHLSPFNFYTSPPPSPLRTDGVRNDVEERFDLLDRISNQATVKSDTYTVYIVVQGWRNAGSTSASSPPQMVSQKRAAFIIDRTGVTPTSSNVKIINVPTD